jgi:hypothetical protein
MNSAVLTLALISHVATAAMSSIACDSCDIFQSAKIVGPISLSPPSYEEDVVSRNSTTDYFSELPFELAELIASAEQSEPSTESKSEDSNVKYFASYTEGSLCSTKSAASFERWEESFSSLEECCEIAFSWDMDTCLGR